MQICNNPQGTFKSFDSQRQEFEAKVRSNKIENKENVKEKVLVAAASLAGAVIPLALYNIKKGCGSEIKDVFQRQSSKLTDKLKTSSKLIEVENIKQIGISVTGSILAGLGAGTLLDKNPDNKQAKIKESIYGFLNCMIPMSIISLAEYAVEKRNIKTGILGKAALVAAGIGSGMLLSNKVANSINKTVFKEEDDKFEKRKIKPTDCLVHLDDILGVAVLSKIPFAKELGKALPLIYTHVGYESGEAKKKQNV